MPSFSDHTANVFTGEPRKKDGISLLFQGLRFYLNYVNNEIQ
jgi:hypothetical protein